MVGLAVIHWSPSKQSSVWDLVTLSMNTASVAGQPVHMSHLVAKAALMPKTALYPEPQNPKSQTLTLRVQVPNNHMLSQILT